MFVLANATIATPDPQITGQLAVVIVNTLLIAEAAFHFADPKPARA